MKIIQALIIAFAIIGCFALALGGFLIYNMTQSDGDNFLTKFKQARAAKAEAAETTAPVVAKNSEYAQIIQQYQPTPTPTPVPTVMAQVPGAAPGVMAPVAVPAASTPAAKPVTTPKPDEGKIRSWPTGRKLVALTYDDGPHPEWTPKMMELLQSKNVKATFFLLGEQIKRFPEIAKKVADAGFEIGNHTISHPDFNKSAMTPDKIREELQGTNDLIAEHATREPIRVMRPPYCNTPKKLQDICQDMGLHIIAWNIDTNDWDRKTEAKDMVENVMKNLSDGSIILMHDRHQKSYDTTAEIIDKIRAQGYEFVTMSELLGLKPLSAAQPAAPAAQPVAAAQPAAGNVPAPAGQPAAGAAQTPAGSLESLPVPQAAQPTQAPTGETLDESKITRPPS